MNSQQEIKDLAEKLVEALLDEQELPGPQNPLPVKLKMPDGQIVIGTFTGYYGPGKLSIGYPDGKGGFSHGLLGKDVTLLTMVPPIEAYQDKGAQY